MLPFDDTTWMLFALVFIIAFAVVALLKLSKTSSISTFVFGENVSTPGLNIYAVFMGIGQQTLPFRTIARILLMNLVVFSLIMRTAYQGKFFEFLTTDPHKRSLSSIEDIIEKKFPLYTELAENGKGKGFYASDFFNQ